MSEKLPKRLARVERMLVDISDPQRWGNCNCLPCIVADEDKPEEFEEEMNRPCLRHGKRRLGLITIVSHIAFPPDGRLDKLVKTYRARLFPGRGRLDQLRRVGAKLRNEQQES